jgi:hypothetical protein
MKLLLFGTLGCHLCEEAEEIIALCEKKRTSIENIDIAEQLQWQDKYAIRIPVLFCPETEKELAWPFTQMQVQTFIDELNND